MQNLSFSPRSLLASSSGAFLVSLLLAVGSLLLPTVASAHPAITYSCPSPNNHCHGLFQEYSNNATPPVGAPKYTGFNNFYGGYTSPNIVQITGFNTDTDGILNEEMWLLDKGMSGTHQCYASWSSGTGYTGAYPACWTETGYQAVSSSFTSDTNAGHEAWFTSVIRPIDGYVASPFTAPYCDPNWNGACLYQNVYGSQLVSGDYGNANGDVEVYFDGTTSHQVDTLTQSTSTGTSTTIAADYMVPTEIDTGTELSGTSGINGPKVHFKLNQYQSSVGGSWTYQSIDGDYENDNPPLAGWTTSKRPSQTANGGDFETCVFTNCTL